MKKISQVKLNYLVAGLCLLFSGGRMNAHQDEPPKLECFVISSCIVKRSTTPVEHIEWRDSYSNYLHLEQYALMKVKMKCIAYNGTVNEFEKIERQSFESQVVSYWHKNIERERQRTKPEAIKICMSNLNAVWKSKYEELYDYCQ